MSKKHTYEYVKNYFEERGCKLLEDKYINAQTKMNYKCSCGNISKIKFNNFQQGQLCMECSGSKKYTYQYVKEYFEKYNCKLLSNEYFGIEAKLKYKCNCGNISKITFSHFKQGHRCRKCGNKKISLGLKYNYEYVKKYFKDNGCKLLEKKYINNNTKMRYICVCGRVSRINFDNFKKGHRCSKCGGNCKYIFDYVRDFFKKQGCELLEKEYIDCKTKMRYRCCCGKISKISFGNFKKGKRCKECGIIKISAKNHYKWIEDREKLEEDNKFRRKCRNLLGRTLNKINLTKTDKTANLLGYTVRELENRIYFHPNWKKIKDKDWHLDHIFPIKAFLDYGITDLKLINCLENLRPLEASENESKHDYYNEEDFEWWLKTKDYEIQ